MASTVVGNPDKHRFNKEMYSALMKRNKHKVINLCGRATDGALHIVTIHNDTVLHMATYSKQLHLVRKLLSALPNNPVVKLNHQNDNGNTILHEAATTNQALVAAEEMLQKDRGLLRMRNNLGETALFRAAHYGKTRIFKFLADKISEFREPNSHAFFKRRDNTTVLHISILAEHFDLALVIAERNPDLINEPDPAGLTGLQLLSCNPTAFKWRNNDAFKRLMYSVDPYCSLPWRKADQKDKHKYESALKLAKLLIERDTSWEVTNPGIEGLQTSNRTSMGMTSETPLFLATKSGCVEIVEEILNQYPQAVEHVNNEGQNILHLAIKYRQLQIFNLVKKMKIPMKRLVRNVDIHGNSILHMIGMKRENSEFEKMQNPADKLQEELQWFELVEKVTKTHLINHGNRDKQTADGLFAITNRNVHSLAKEWIKRTSEGCTIVAILIASVTFAAAYAMPGGPNQQTGFPILLYQRFFMIFIVSDITSLTFALIAVVTFLLILTSPFQIENFKKSLPQRLMLAVNFLLLSLLMMMIAFAATIVLKINRKESWTKAILYAVPVGIFLLAYFPLYILLSKAYRFLLKNTETWSQNVPLVLLKISHSFKNPQTQIINPSNLPQSQTANSTNSMCPATSQTSNSAV